MRLIKRHYNLRITSDNLYCGVILMWFLLILLLKTETASCEPIPVSSSASTSSGSSSSSGTPVGTWTIRAVPHQVRFSCFDFYRLCYSVPIAVILTDQFQYQLCYHYKLRTRFNINYVKDDHGLVVNLSVLFRLFT